MSFSAFRVFSPALSRWCTFPNYNLFFIYERHFFLRPFVTCSKWVDYTSGMCSPGREWSSLHGYGGSSWSTISTRQGVPSFQCYILRNYSFGEKKEIESKAGNISNVNPTETKTDSEDISHDVKKLSLMQRFKQMYRDYWYVLVPVHLVTSVGWFGSFYYLAKSGVDVVALLESMGISQTIIEPLRDSSAGYIALSYAMYKIATPIRYTVTLGGTTLSIKYLKEYGYIKPIPPKEKLKEMYQEKKDNLMERRDNLAEEFRQRKERFKERRETFIDEYRKRTKK